jgi:hypothetical protein
MKIFGYHIVIKKDKPKTALHQLNKSLIEYCFEIDGVQYYQFKNYIDIPPLRYAKICDFMEEVTLGLSRESLQYSLEKITEAINAGDIKKMAKIISMIEYQIEAFSNTDILYRLCSSVFITLDEDISVYDEDYNNEKIKAFKSVKAEDFFLTKSIKGLFPQVDFSNNNIPTFFTRERVVKKFMESIS